MVMRDDDPRKWDYPIHTRAKHAVLERYMKAWLAILGRGRRYGGGRSRLTIVDGFAGRGSYNDGSEGSPLIFRRVAAQVLQGGLVDEVELFFIEAHKDNYADLASALAGGSGSLGLVLNPPIYGEFASEAPAIVELMRRKGEPSFWFIDPFGFAGVPLSLIRDILSTSRSEVFVTFMARDVNRFLENPHHQTAIAELLDLCGVELKTAIAKVAGSSERTQALRQLYETRLREAGGATHVWPFRVAERGMDDTIYYLVHGSTSIKAFREMKDATKKSGGGTFAFLGREDFAAQMQAPLFDLDEAALPNQLLEVFCGREISFEQACNEAYPDERFYRFTEPDFRRALNVLVRRRVIIKVPVDTRGQRGLQGQDRLRFPASLPQQPSRSATPIVAEQLPLFR